MKTDLFNITFVEAILYLVGFTLMAIAVLVVMLELPSPFGRALAIFLMGYLIVRIGEWTSE
jgi:hypothetical protein